MQSRVQRLEKRVTCIIYYTFELSLFSFLTKIEASFVVL